MSILLKPNGKGITKEQDKFGVDIKKMERTGKDTFVAHGSGGNYFEGKITDPRIKFKDSGRITMMLNGVEPIVNPCQVCANNKYRTEDKTIQELCESCEDNKNYKEIK